MIVGIVVFIALFVIFIVLGFMSYRWRKGNLAELSEWALVGRKLGPYLAWFLVGADLYTAYTFIAVPAGMFGSGALYFFAVPYVMATFAVAIVTMSALWKKSRENNYVTAVDFVKDRFNSRTLAILIAVTGIVAELPYIALQIVGMRAVLVAMFYSYADVNLLSEIGLIVSFILLAAFTFWSGLRGATLTAIMKDVIILSSVIVIIIYVPLHYGGFANAFASMGHYSTISPVTHKAVPVSSAVYATLSPTLYSGYISLFILSALALYLYPHAVNGVLSSRDVKAVRYSSALLPLYGIGLGIIALFGILIYAVPAAMHMVAPSGNIAASSTDGALVVPALIVTTLPGWFAGYALLGIFIGGLVPAAIMAISQANLLTRNVIGEFRKLTPEQETRIAKWASVIFKFIALGFVFIVPATYAIQLQLLGGILIAQTLPPVFIGLFTKWLNKYGLILGWIAGIASGLFFVISANLKFGYLFTSLMASPFGLLYVAMAALAINIAVAFLVSLVIKVIEKTSGKTLSA
ncbi:MAG: sodium:solute symporter family protein [Thermoplasmataceae archaeon]